MQPRDLESTVRHEVQRRLREDGHTSYLVGRMLHYIATMVEDHHDVVYLVDVLLEEIDKFDQEKSKPPSQ